MILSTKITKNTHATSVADSGGKGEFLHRPMEKIVEKWHKNLAIRKILEPLPQWCFGSATMPHAFSMH